MRAHPARMWQGNGEDVMMQSMTSSRPARSVALLASLSVVAVGAVVPSATASDAIAYDDSFERSTSSGWGSADVGGSWTSPTGDSDLWVSDGRGRMELRAGAAGAARISGSGSADMDLTVDVSSNRTASGGGQYFSLIARGTERTGYRLTARNRDNGYVELSLRRMVNGQKTILTGTRVADLMPAAGASVRMRLVVEGSGPTTIKAKAWQVGASEPSDWLLTAEDSSTAVPSSPGAGVISYLSSSSQDDPVRFRYDNFRVTEPTSSTPAPPPAPEPPPSGSAKPTAGSTGVPDGTNLKVLTRSNRPYSGDTIYSDGSTLIINTPNAVYDGYRFDMFVEVKAPGVKIRNSHFRGDDRTTYSRGLLLVHSDNVKNGPASVVVEDSTLIPRAQSNLLDGVRGSNITLRRVEIAGTVDGVGVYGTGSSSDPHAGNVTIKDSWIHDLRHYNDGSHSDGTHHDAIQVMGGKNIVITGNRIDGSIYNAGLMITHGRNDVSDVTFSGNWAGGGGCTVNVSDSRGPIPGVVMENNVFTRGSTRVKDCAMLATSDTRSVTVARNNTWHDGSTPAPTIKNGG